VVKRTPSGWRQQAAKSVVKLTALIVVLNVMLSTLNTLLPWLIGIGIAIVVMSLLHYYRWR
jgi:hypothetical protein